MQMLIPLVLLGRSFGAEMGTAFSTSFALIWALREAVEVSTSEDIGMLILLHSLGLVISRL
jgi:hypothetical protein